MNYRLNDVDPTQKVSTTRSLRSLLAMMAGEKKQLWLALLAILVNSGLTLLAPLVIGHSIDRYVVHKDYHGLLLSCLLLLGIYAMAFFSSYFQVRMMGNLGQRMLFLLRNAVFEKLQQLPVAFFQANKAGDLISRVNNDTEKLNTFFSQALTQFIGNLATMVGAGIFLLAIDLRLGAASLVPALFIFLFSRLVAPWVKTANAESVKSEGGLSGEIQESLQNFKVIIAFNRRDYFRERFQLANSDNYRASIRAGVANNLFLPVFTLFSGLAQLVVLGYGIYLISHGQFTVGLLVSYLAYAVNFYNPLRQLATLWSTLQVALAGWDRISAILKLETNLVTLPETRTPIIAPSPLMEFRDVYFGYSEGKEILHDINFSIAPGRTYAFVGPTGGGKTTTASLMARLYDPTAGTIFLGGKDLRTYSAAERAQRIAFILQEPFLFTGTIRDNLRYGNEALDGASDAAVDEQLAAAGLEKLLGVFETGLDTAVSSGGENISLGQKQIIAFMRAVLRRPDLLILDEATANIDTVTEQLLQEILEKLPAHSSRIVIAHRLNTIENADEIYFVNAGEVIRAGSFQDALDKLLQGKRAS